MYMQYQDRVLLTMSLDPNLAELIDVSGNSENAPKNLEGFCVECKKSEPVPGEDRCAQCMGINTSREDYIGSEEWKEEMRYFWPMWVQVNKDKK